MMKITPVVTPQPELTYEQLIERIEQLIANPPQTSRILTFTPELAEYILETYNIENRPRKPGNIKRYAQDMTDNLWPLTGDTLKFSDRKRLRDGQNRLHACVLSDVPFTSHVVFGIDDKCFSLLDRGKNRDPSDILAIAGIAHPKATAAAIKWAEKLQNDPKGRETIQPKAVLDLARSTYVPGDIHGRIAEARAIYDNTKHPVGLVAAILWHAYLTDPRKARTFAEVWAERGEKSRRGRPHRPIAAMISALNALHAASSGRIHDTVRAAWAVIAWNGFVEDRKLSIKSFAWGPRDEFPEML